MPKPKDITGEILNMRGRLNTSPVPVPRPSLRPKEAKHATHDPLRRHRFEPTTWFAWGLTSLFVLSQFIVVLWLRQ